MTQIQKENITTMLYSKIYSKVIHWILVRFKMAF